MLDSTFWIPSFPWLPCKLSVENPMQKKLSVIWHDAVGGLPSDFWILWSGILVNRIGAMAFPFLSFFLASKGFSENVAALAVFCWGIGGLTASVFVGMGASQIWRTPTMLARLFL